MLRTGSEVKDVVEDRASCGNYSPRFGSWFANTDLEEDGELAPRRHRDVAVAAPRASRGHPSLWYWMIWFMKCTDNVVSRRLARRGAGLGQNESKS